MRRFGLWMVIFMWMSLTISADCYAQEETPERPLTRKEQRKEERAERKRLKNAPLVLPELSRDGFSVSGGQRFKSETSQADSLAVTDSLSSEPRLDSLAMSDGRHKGMRSDSVILEDGEKYSQYLTDSTFMATDSLGDRREMLMYGTVDYPDSAALALMSARERRQLRREQMRADTNYYRHSPLFRDTIPISHKTLISFVVPGFGQLYNGDYWKIPALYATVGTSLYLGIRQHKQYVKYRDEYNGYLLRDPNRIKYTDRMDALQTRMIQHNTWRQMLFAGAIGSYLYFIGDGVLNHPSKNASVKMATTLSTIFPGAGQFYNGSYWRATIVVGGIASMLYVIDWNDRIYKRTDMAYKAIDDDDPNTNPPSHVSHDPASLRNTRDSARRNRDLCIILTGLVYFINIMDAHVDAHLKDWDVSDDLGYRFRLEPSLNMLSTQTGGTTSAFGLNVSYTF